MAGDARRPTRAPGSASPKAELVHSHISHLILLCSLLCGLASAIVFWAPAITFTSYVNLPITWIIVGIYVALFPTDPDMNSRWARIFRGSFLFSVLIGFARQVQSNWPLSERYSNPYSVVTHQIALILVAFNWVTLCGWSASADSLYRYGIRYGSLTLVVCVTLQLLERRTLAPPFLKEIWHMAGCPTFEMAMARSVNAFALSFFLRSSHVRRRLSRAAGFIHATVPLGDLRGLDLTTSVEAILNAPPGDAWSDSCGRGRSDSCCSGSTANSEADVPATAAEPDGARSSHAHSVGARSSHAHSVGGTESLASTLLDEDELATREFINTQSATHVHRWFQSTVDRVPEEPADSLSASNLSNPASNEAPP